MDPLQQLKLEYQESTAYHEAAHEVACIAPRIPIREFGLRIDSEGHGASHTYRRSAGDLNNTETDIREREESIVLLFAGFWGQVRVFAEIEDDAIAKDQSQIDELLDEMYPHKSVDWQAAKNKLREESHELVAEYWPAIEALAKTLWAKPWKPQEKLPTIDMGWSDDKVEKSIDAKEVEAIVKPFGLNPIILADAAGTWIRPAEY
jgi:hypothetical protein